MSGMLEGVFSGGAKHLPPSEPHDEFLELCAAATTGSLTAGERSRLNAHLAQCASCREIRAQYEAILGQVIPAWAPDSGNVEQGLADWSVDDAEKRLFARLNESDLSTIPPADNPIPPLAGSSEAPNVPRFSGESLWRHLWSQYAAALLMIAVLGLMAYRIGIRRGTDIAEHAPPPTPVRSADPPANSQSLGDRQSAPPVRTVADYRVEALRSQIDKDAKELSHLKAEVAQTEDELGVERAGRIKDAEDSKSLAQQLQMAQRDLQAAQQKLDSFKNDVSNDNAHYEALQQKADELTQSLHERDQEVARDRELLDHDRDIRELMGSRDLYIAEVFDVAKTGDTQKPFGRVFYTKGKSLIFYAYDLDQQQGIERTSSFQAWGRVGPDREHAVNLGILYQDNANRKRWVVKSDNPKTLAQIDAVFVTVEPNGGSTHPSGKPLLFAYLRIQPNHP